jgi:hypothetical protein
MGVSRMATNTIASVKTVELDSPTGPLVAIMIALNIGDSKHAVPFVREVAQKFNVHRTCSSPETAALLVTIIGDFSASEFAKQWKELQGEDQILKFYMSMMRMADVMHGTESGEVLEMASLL